MITEAPNQTTINIDVPWDVYTNLEGLSFNDLIKFSRVYKNAWEVECAVNPHIIRSEFKYAWLRAEDEIERRLKGDAK